MNADQTFSIANSLALLGWLILIFAGRMRQVSTLICGIVIPLLFAVAYLSLLALHFSEGHGSFNSLSGVAALFANRWILLAGWIHYLAFDLFIGSWQVRDATKHGIPHLLVVPCLILTFMYGPIGLLMYSAIRFWKTKTLSLVSPA